MLSLEREVDTEAARRNGEVAVRVFDGIRNNRNNQIRREMNILEENQRMFCLAQKFDVDIAIHLMERMYRPLLDANICHFRAMLGPSGDFHNEIILAMSKMYSSDCLDLDDFAFQIGQSILEDVRNDLILARCSGDHYVFAPYIPVIFLQTNPFISERRILTRFAKKIMPIGMPRL